MRFQNIFLWQLPYHKEVVRIRVVEFDYVSTACTSQCVRRILVPFADFCKKFSVKGVSFY